MADYKSMYSKQFNAITDVIRILQKSQADTEEMYLSQKDADIVLLDPQDDSEKE